MATRPEEIAALVPANSLLSACSREELVDLFSHGSVAPFRMHDTLLAQGEDGDSLVMLLSGCARVSMVSSNGREIILDYAEEGTVLGEIALLDSQPRTATATAIAPGKLLRVSRAAVEAFVERHPRVALRMMRAMAGRLRQATSTIESDRAFAAGPRLARHLRRLIDERRGSRLRHDLSQAELGSFVGISREHVNRQLSAWADAGVVEVKGGRIRVLDRGYLDDVVAAAI